MHCLYTHSLVAVVAYTVMCFVAPWPEKLAGGNVVQTIEFSHFKLFAAGAASVAVDSTRVMDSMQVPVTSSRSTDATPVCLLARLLSAC
jgi:hypothetical protein